MSYRQISFAEFLAIAERTGEFVRLEPAVRTKEGGTTRSSVRAVRRCPGTNHEMTFGGNAWLAYSACATPDWAKDELATLDECAAANALRLAFCDIYPANLFTVNEPAYLNDVVTMMN